MKEISKVILSIKLFSKLILRLDVNIFINLLEYQVNNEVIIKDKKVIALKKGDLIGQKKTFVNGKIIYLFKDKTLFKYDSKNNSM